jgi:tetratricopeptide (TPR) repeat protein
MKPTVRYLAVPATLLALLFTAGCSKLKARDQLNKGVQAYKAAKYDTAIEHFKNAVALDDKLAVARLYLATAYAQQCVPQVDTPDNIQMCNQAIDEFKKQLENDPSSINSMKGIASLYFNMKKLDEAKDYHRRVIQLDPNDPEEYYSVAVIDWTEAYKTRMDARNKIGLKPEDPIKDQKVCNQIKDQNLEKVDEAINYLNKALEVRKDYDDAMAYLNLLYREKADIECGNADARRTDLATADDWVKKTMDTKKAKAEKQAGPGGIVLDQPKSQ